MVNPESWVGAAGKTWMSEEGFLLQQTSCVSSTRNHTEFIKITFRNIRERLVTGSCGSKVSTSLKSPTQGNKPQKQHSQSPWSTDWQLYQSPLFPALVTAEYNLPGWDLRIRKLPRVSRVSHLPLGRNASVSEKQTHRL